MITYETTNLPVSMYMCCNILFQHKQAYSFFITVHKQNKKYPGQMFFSFDCTVNTNLLRL